MSNRDDQKQKAPQGLSWGSGAAAASPRQTDPGKEVVGVFGTNTRTQASPSTQPKAADELFVPPVKSSSGNYSAYNAPPRGSFVPKQVPAAPPEGELQSFDEHTEPTRVVSFAEMTAEMTEAEAAPPADAGSKQVDARQAPPAKAAPAGSFGVSNQVTKVDLKVESSSLPMPPVDEPIASQAHSPAIVTHNKPAVVTSTTAAHEDKRTEDKRSIAATGPTPASAARPDSRAAMDAVVSLPTRADRADSRSMAAVAPAPANVTRPESRSSLAAQPLPERDVAAFDAKAQLGATMLGVSPPPQGSTAQGPNAHASGTDVQVKSFDAASQAGQSSSQEPVSIPPDDVEFFLSEETSDPGVARRPAPPPFKRQTQATKVDAPKEQAHVADVVVDHGDPLELELSGSADTMAHAVPDHASASSAHTPDSVVAGTEFEVGIDAPAAISNNEREPSSSKVKATLVGIGPEADEVRELVREAKARTQPEAADAVVSVEPPSEDSIEVVDSSPQAETQASAALDVAPTSDGRFTRRAIAGGALIGLVGGAAFAFFSGGQLPASSAPRIADRGIAEAPAAQADLPPRAPSVTASPAAVPSKTEAQEVEEVAAAEMPAVPEDVAAGPAAEPASPAEEHAAEPEPAAVEASAQTATAASPPPAEEATTPAPPLALPAGASTRELLAQAREQVAAGDAKGAEPLLRALLAKNPKDHHIMEVLARALLDVGKGGEALGYAEKIVKRRPNRSPYYVILGDALKATGRGEAAQQAYLEALALDPNNIAAERRVQ